MTSINTNIGALSAQANMTRVNDELNTAMTRLSTGLRINAAKDDAAGMAIGEKMTAQVMGLNQAVRNATDGKNLIDTTESAHVEVSNMMQRLRELAVQSANDTNTSSDRGNIVAESRQLIAEINRVSETTTFNGMKVMDGSFEGKQFQIGADANQTVSVNVESTRATDIGAFTMRSDVNVVAANASTIAASTSIIVSGHAGSAEITQTAGMSAKDLAAAINGQTSETAVSANAQTVAKLSGLSAAGQLAFEINEVELGEVAISDASDLRSLRDAINAKTTETGVTARMGDTNAEIILTDTSGENIALSGFTSDDGAGTALSLDVDVLNADGTASTSAFTSTTTIDDTAADATVTGQVTLSSTKVFSVHTSDNTADEAFFADSNGAGNLEQLAEINLSTADGAAKAVNVIDMALAKVSQSRSDLGAISNRLDSTISNLTNISTSVESARSQVMDADFAAESTNLARGQILSQAATAMLAQANASKQNVMSLLRG
ncbi:MAG: flagellin [Roseibaca calidilacus]|uniref:Flagellin n=1 Tax=Roseibaca calidilacus TaxID=1666912 RepID=A0A0P7Z1K9_9RHOB|nr:flagellin [Roseibaca calidilacus]KPP95556.1 MAG: flagellin [Roseibaca calidilacus]CUX82097.1 flagellin [Roseibaca calidilacus]